MPTAEIKQLLETSEHSSIQGVVVVVREELAGLARPSSSTPRGTKFTRVRDRGRRTRRIVVEM